MRFSGKCVVITGAASGIGRAATLLFAREGATVFAADLNLAGAEAVAREGENIVPVACDVCDVPQIKALMDHAAGTCGGIDVLFNNAAAGGARGAADGDAAGGDEQISRRSGRRRQPVGDRQRADAARARDFVVARIDRLAAWRDGPDQERAESLESRSASGLDLRPQDRHGPGPDGAQGRLERCGAAHRA